MKRAEIQSLSPEQIDTSYAVDSDITQLVDAAYNQRAQYLENLAGLAVYTPELPESSTDELYERLVEYEHRIAPNLRLSEYGEGAARSDDELIIANGTGRLAVSADHATDPVRKATGIREGADHGTAALAFALHEDTGAGIVLPSGRQTGNANVDPEHPLKDVLGDMLPSKSGFLSVHGMMPGKFVHQLDPTEIHAVLGLGTHPTERSQEIADRVVEHAKDEYGLKVVVGNTTQFFNAQSTPRLERDADGNLKYSARLAAAGAGSTTNFVQRQVGDSAIPALQIEMSRSLRLLPQEMEYRDKRARRVAVYMGYQLVKSLADEILKP